MGIGKEFRKEISLRGMKTDLEKLAKANRMQLKPYIEKVLVDHIEKVKIKDKEKV
jgi:hypothetical protein